MTHASATTAFVGMVALPSLLFTWRCSGCRHIVARLEYNERSVIEHRCKCNRWNRLPDDVDHLRVEGSR